MSVEVGSAYDSVLSTRPRNSIEPTPAGSGIQKMVSPRDLITGRSSSRGSIVKKRNFANMDASPSKKDPVWSPKKRIETTGKGEDPIQSEKDEIS